MTENNQNDLIPSDRVELIRLCANSRLYEMKLAHGDKFPLGGRKVATFSNTSKSFLVTGVGLVGRELLGEVTLGDILSQEVTPSIYQETW